VTIVKICGIASAGDAVQVAGLGVDIIGLILAPSRRRIDIQGAAEIVRRVKLLPQRPAVAGVFVNQSLQTVNDTAAYCGLDMVQLSGDESWDYCRGLERPFIKVIHVEQRDNLEKVVRDVDAGYQAVLGLPFLCMLDCKNDGGYGGSGRSFDWDIAADACARFPLLVAGGLSPVNVRRLIRKAGPCGVDVSTGVESAGRKDMKKVRDFVLSVRMTGGQAAGGREMLIRIMFEGEGYATR
jgi:phosphoribosylanthranilate isomerase